MKTPSASDASYVFLAYCLRDPLHVYFKPNTFKFVPATIDRTIHDQIAISMVSVDSVRASLNIMITP